MRLFSGMRPTGPLHLGHLAGALGNWVKLQEDYHSFFTIADWHALTTTRNTERLPSYILDMALSWRAAGIDFDRSVVFVQSDVKEHAEMHLLLSMVTPMSWLERDPTLKTMLEDLQIQSISYGLMGYPVLQAADILLYKAEAVPVGVDQVPHVEIAREIARAFNRTFGAALPEPKALLTDSPKLLGMDGKKMSKSLGNCIYLDDTPETVALKAAQLVTDPKKIHANDPGDPDICSVQDYHKVFSPADAPSHDADCRAGRLGCVAHKKYLGDILVRTLAGYRYKRAELTGREEETRALLAHGASRARAVAADTMEQLRWLVGGGSGG
jgi:tryptophanyl-tRNA synthetase